MKVGGREGRESRVEGRVMRRGRILKFLRWRWYRAAVGLLLGLLVGVAHAQPVGPVLELAKNEQPALIETLRQLTAFESGSRELGELARIADALAARLKALGGKVEMIEAAA